MPARMPYSNIADTAPDTPTIAPSPISAALDPHRHYGPTHVSGFHALKCPGWRNIYLCVKGVDWDARAITQFLSLL